MPITRRYLSKKRKRMTLRDKRKTRRGGNKSSQYEEQFGFSPVVKKLSYAPQETSTDSPSKTLRRSKKGTFGNQLLLLSTMDSPLTNPDRPTTVFEKPDSAVYGFPEELVYDDIIKVYYKKLTECSDPNECLKWLLVGLYLANVEPQFIKLYERLEKTKTRKEINEDEYNTKKNNLTGRHKENKHVLVNIINRNNFDSLPIPPELKNENSVRTVIDPKKEINNKKNWLQAYEECLYFYIKLATNEFYAGYDCKIEYPIFKHATKKSGFRKVVSAVIRRGSKSIKGKNCNINWDAYDGNDQIKALFNNRDEKLIIENFIIDACTKNPDTPPITVMAAAKTLGLIPK